MRAGDRLGVYIEEAPGAIAYTFDVTNPSVLAHTQTNVPELIALNDVIYFQAIVFPYEFSVTAYFDTNMSQYGATDDDFPTCPKGLKITGLVTVSPTGS